MAARDQLEQAIAAQESLRGTLDDAIIDATIATLREKLAALKAAPSQQRKLATILFMDIAGHTAIIRDLDPEENMAIIDPALARLAAVVEVHGGHIARYQGDGFKAVFGLPVAQENDPDNAVRAGLAILAETKAIAKELKEARDISGFQVRVGIDTGLVLSGGETEGEDTIKGTPVNLAARLESAAEPGTLAISHNTYRHVRGVFTMQRLEPVAAKGFPEPVEVYRVLGEKARSFRTRRHGVEGVDTRMVGRDRELGLLQEIFVEVLEEGQRQIVTIVGEAGVGKSRLLYEFESWVDLEPDPVRLYRGRAHLETRRLPYGLLRSIFAFRFGIQDDDPVERVREKWIAGFLECWGETGSSELEDKVEMRAHILGQLLGMDFSDSPHVEPILKDPQQMRDRSVAYLVDYFQAVSQKSPVLILLEDLHWGDDSSLDALSQVGVRVGEAVVMIVGVGRPELYDRRPYWFEGWDFHRRVDLKPLSRKVCRGLVGEVLQRVVEVPEALEDLVVTHAEGNPFYVEELVKVLVETGVIVKGDPQWRVDEGKLAEAEVPSTLTGVLQARLERLTQGERTLIQQASVVGRVFWDQAVRYLNHQGGGVLEEEGIENGLANLRGREMIYRRELSTFLEAQEYIFKHAVLREVTYEGVLKRLRRVYHGLAAEWLIEQRGDRSGEVVGLIADHLELAGERKEALRYLRWAGESAAAKYANEEATDYFSRALDLVPDEDLEARFELLLSREEVLDRQAKRELQRQDLEMLETIAKKLGDLEKGAEVWMRYSLFHFYTDDYKASAEAAERVVEQAEAIGDTQFSARGQLAWGRALVFATRLKSARKHLSQALVGFRSTGDKHLEGWTHRSLGLVAQAEMDYPSWQEFSEQALKLAQEVGDRLGEAEAIHHLGIIALELGDYQAAKDLLERYLGITRETGYRFQEYQALNSLGYMANVLMDYQSARGFYEKGLAISREINSIRGRSISLAGLGDTLVRLEQWDQAIQSYKGALKLIEKIGEVRRSWGIKSGLAMAKLGAGDRTAAQNIAEEFLNYLGGGGSLVPMWYSPLQVYLSCVQVLLANKDPRVGKLLKTAYTMMEEVAGKIKDDEMRRSFLENVPWNREIVRLWEEQQAEGET